METIIAAGIKSEGGRVFQGRRHCIILRSANPRGSLKGGEQGFVTSTGRFVDRKEAAKIALAAGQIKELKYQKETLFSEELW